MKLAVLILLLAPGLGLAQKTPLGPKICFETETIDFGTIKKGANGAFTFHFTNEGDEPLIIESGTSGCGCLVCEWPRDPILPRAKGRIRLTYDTQRVAYTRKSVVITSNSKDNPVVTLTIKGTVYEPQEKQH